MRHPTRREFVAAGAGAALAAGQSRGAEPWYRRTRRWGQTNITEMDPVRYDIPWWREYWKRTRVQGVILNAGGIVAYYPSRFPLQHRAEFLKDRDLYGELAAAAHADGLTVIARMDSNRAAEDFYKAHPDWFTRDREGAPYRAADKYITCINSLYYDEYLPAVLTEIIERTHPQGFADNSWSGLSRDQICYCENCSRQFRDQRGHALPTRVNWDDAAYREWILWNYARRLEVWDLNNRATKKAGGEDCLWFGMNSGSVSSQSRAFRDFKAILERAPMVFLDHQARGAAGFQENADTGRLVHGVLGWDKLAPESMAMYQSGRPSSFRLAAKPAAEARMWMIEGFAGGIQPWWHFIGAWHEDRRMHDTPEALMQWYAANEAYMVDRKPLANIGVVWSQRNTDFYGRDKAGDLTDAPYRGYVEALMRARIPYVPVHVDHIERESATLRALILPNVAAMSDGQCEAVKRFVAGGGSVVATGVTSLYTEFGDARRDFGLASLFGAHFAGKGREEEAWAGPSQHTYLRLAKERHRVLQGFEKTDILPFGGRIPGIAVEAGNTVPLTFIPAFPIYPPETSWMREPRTDVPGLIVRGRVAFLPADIDRRHAREPLPDYADLLANLARWASRDQLPVEVEGPGVLDCNAYTQGARVVVHVVNLTSTGWMPVREVTPVGAVKVKVRAARGSQANLLVAGRTVAVKREGDFAVVTLEQVGEHEVVVV